MDDPAAGGRCPGPFDLFSPAFKADPFPTYAQMRRDAPIYAHEAPDGATIWYVTRYDDALAVLRDDESFGKDPRLAVAGGRRAAAQQAINANMLFSDPPQHTRLRALVSQAFTPRRVAALAPQIQTIADELLDVVLPYGRMDLIGAYALPLPIYVISEMLGVPAADRVRVADWSQAIISPGNQDLTYSARKRRIKALTRYLEELFAARAATPHDDLITALVQAEEAGDRLSPAELSSMVTLLLVTGHETTVNLVGNGALALLGHEGARRRLAREPELWATAVEELLRYDGPVETATSRWARHDMLFRGHTIRRGDLVRVVLSSANRDPHHFAAPAELNLDRTNNKHLAFGFGIHYCLGAPLARLEGRIALQTLFERLPGLQLSTAYAELPWRSGVLFRGLRRCEVCWPL